MKIINPTLLSYPLPIIIIINPITITIINILIEVLTKSNHTVLNSFIIINLIKSLNLLSLNKLLNINNITTNKDKNNLQFSL